MCDQAPPGADAGAIADGEVVEVRDLTGVDAGEVVFVGEAWFAVEVRVARLRGESCVACAVAVSGSGNSWG